MLQQEKPEDYVVATGENHSVKDFVDAAFLAAGLNYELVDLHMMSPEMADMKIEELRKDKGRLFVVQHPMFFRPAEVHNLLGDPSKAKMNLGWQPEVSFQELVRMMVEEDIRQMSG